jgi:hypothetical protein
LSSEPTSSPTVDDAAARAAAEHERGGPFQHLDLLDVEQIAVVLAEIAHAVEKEVTAGRKAAQVVDVVRLRSSFRGGVADAGHVAQRVAKRGRALRADHLLRHGVDELRDVPQRSVGAGRAARRLAAKAFLLALHPHLGQDLLGLRQNRRRKSQQHRRRDRAALEALHVDPFSVEAAGCRRVAGWLKSQTIMVLISSRK